MLTDRNRMSHMYDSDTFEAIKEIEERYVERFRELHRRLSREIAEQEVGES